MLRILAKDKPSHIREIGGIDNPVFKNYFVSQ